MNTNIIKIDFLKEVLKRKDPKESLFESKKAIHLGSSLGKDMYWLKSANACLDLLVEVFGNKAGGLALHQMKRIELMIRDLKAGRELKPYLPGDNTT